MKLPSFKMSWMRAGLGLFLSLLVLPTESAFILQTKNKQALIDLEGLRTRKGAYFTAVDMYGNNRGFVQIKKIGPTKAIGSLEMGRMKRGWSLMPVSKSRVLAVKKSAERKAVRRIARIRKEKIKNSLKKSRLLRQRRLSAEKRRESERHHIEQLRHRPSRHPASYENDRNWDDFEDSSWSSSYDDRSSSLEDSPYRSSPQPDVSYQDIPPEENSVQPSTNYEDNLQQSTDYRAHDPSPPEPRDNLSHKPFGFHLGIAPQMSYNFMRVDPSSEEPSYTMKGLGWGLLLFANKELNRFMSAEGSLGWKSSSVSLDGDTCGQRRDCLFETSFLSAGAHIKLNAAHFNKHKLWIGVEGDLMYLINESNNVVKQDTLGLIHGSLGLALGMNFQMESFFFPVSLKGGIYMPPSKTITRYFFGLQAGLGYQF